MRPSERRPETGHTMPQRVGIIGYPIGHSLSPVLQQVAFDHHGIAASYQAWQVTPDEVPDFVRGLRETGTLGCNVTVPHKETVIPFLDQVDAWASRAGAVNTIVNRDGRLEGYNTDGIGFLRALKEDAGVSATGKRILIVGAGGAAKGVCLALAGESPDSITIANRTLERAEALAALLQGHGAPASAISLEDPTLHDAARQADIVVNCTTVGMTHGPAEEASPLSRHQLSTVGLVYDLVYNPPQTPLLREAESVGVATLGGLPMLVYQGAASFELWTGLIAPVSLMAEAVRAALH